MSNPVTDTPSLSLLKLEPLHYDGVVAFDKAAHGELHACSRKRLEILCKRPHCVAYVAKSDSGIAGYIVCERMPNGYDRVAVLAAEPGEHATAIKCQLLEYVRTHHRTDIPIRLHVHNEDMALLTALRDKGWRATGNIANYASLREEHEYDSHLPARGEFYEITGWNQLSGVDNGPSFTNRIATYNRRMDGWEKR